MQILGNLKKVLCWLKAHLKFVLSENVLYSLIWTKSKKFCLHVLANYKNNDEEIKRFKRCFSISKNTFLKISNSFGVATWGLCLIVSLFQSQNLFQSCWICINRTKTYFRKEWSICRMKILSSWCVLQWYNFLKFMHISFSSSHKLFTHSFSTSFALC